MLSTIEAVTTSAPGHNKKDIIMLFKTPSPYGTGYFDFMIWNRWQAIKLAKKFLKQGKGKANLPKIKYWKFDWDDEDYIIAVGDSNHVLVDAHTGEVTDPLNIRASIAPVG